MVSCMVKNEDKDAIELLLAQKKSLPVWRSVTSGFKKQNFMDSTFEFVTISSINLIFSSLALLLRVKISLKRVMERRHF